MFDYILFASCLFLLAGSILITIKTRFIQIRSLPILFQMLKPAFSRKKKDAHSHTIAPHKALFTAMSTTMGISTMVAPVIAMQLGGPGALIGFMLTAFFGSAATFVETSLSIQHRSKLKEGGYMGGPMQYLKTLISPKVASLYALLCLILMTVWSAAQANQLAAMFDSPILGAYRVPTWASALLISLLVIITLRGGIKRIGSLSTKLVPLMFTLYLGSCFWIIFSNIGLLGSIFQTIIQSAFSPYQLASGAIVGGLVNTLRWGVFKGTQTTEAGVGTQTFPHSMSSSEDPQAQGALAMLSTYTAGFVALLSGCVALITNTWQDPTLPLGISMVVASFQLYFSYWGIAIVAVTTVLFGFGTILGNCYNGAQSFAYLTQNKYKGYYLAVMIGMIMVGTIADVKFLWSHIDIFLALMVIPHMGALLIHTFRVSAGTHAGTHTGTYNL